MSDFSGAPYFRLDLTELQAFGVWDKEHDTKENCKLHGVQTAIGGRLTFCFTSTIVKVQCGCGAEKDLTDYANW